MLAFLARRLFFAAVALVALAAIVYAMFDVPHGLERVFFHLDFGVTCSYPGCPPVTVLWGRTRHADVYLLLGGLVLGVTTGLSAAVFCATRPRTLATRAIETLALIFYSMPVYLARLARQAGAPQMLEELLGIPGHAGAREQSAQEGAAAPRRRADDV